MKTIRRALLFILIFCVSVFLIDETLRQFNRNGWLPYYAGDPVFQFYPPQDDLNKVARNLSQSEKWKNFTPAFYEDVLSQGSSVLYNSGLAEPAKFDDSVLVQKKPFIVFKPESNFKSDRILKNRGFVYSANYAFDSFSRRVHPKSPPPSETNKTVAVMGCSYVLGVGLNNDETLPFYLGVRLRKARVLNLGIYGGGPNDALDEILNSSNESRYADIEKSKGGLALYISMYDHLQRSLCTSQCFNSTYRSWVLEKSNYQFSDSKPTRQGRFADSRPLKNFIFDFFQSFFFTNYFQLDLASPFSRSHIQHYVKHFAAIKELVKSKYNLDFLLVNYPNTYSHWNEIKAELENQKIDFLDLSGVELESATGRRHKIPYDGHPTALSNEITAEIIALHLNKK